jgi:long-chain fatty acid transport protein
MKLILKATILNIAVISAIWAGGYKIPEQSLNAMALGAAYVAHTTGADSAYYNPANMVFLNERQYIEGGVTFAHLLSTTYRSIPPYSGKSKIENLAIPNFHYVSLSAENFRWGASLTVPAGLTKRWETPFQKLFAEEFTLKVLELSPSIAYRLSDTLSIGGGVRVIYSEGIVKSNGADISAITGNPKLNLARNMEGDTVAFGYNFALAYRPLPDICFAVTYRSNIDLDEEGSAVLSAGGGILYDGEASVSVPLPAALNIAISRTWDETFTLEFNYERTFWSEYKTLDFEYGDTNIGPLKPVFDDPIAKNWRDTNTFRIGATLVLNDITMMMGFAIDETPVSGKMIGFELPDSDAKIFSMGFRYQQTEQLSWGAAFLYDGKEPISLSLGENSRIPAGSFEEGGAFLTTVGVAYEF